MSLLKCDECKAPVSNKAVTCPNCGCPVSETVRNHKHKQKQCICISLGLFLGIVVISFVAVKILSMPDKSGYYNGIRWGSSSQIVLTKLPDTAHINEDKMTVISDEADFCGLAGVSAIAMYEFADDLLSKVTIVISNPKSSSFTANRITETIASNYDKQYGEHTTEIISKVWETSKSKIELMNLTEELIFITFTDKSTLADENSSI